VDSRRVLNDRNRRRHPASSNRPLRQLRRRMASDRSTGTWTDLNKDLLTNRDVAEID